MLSIIGCVGGSLLVAISVAGTWAITGYLFYTLGSLTSIWLLVNSTASRTLIGLNAYFIVVNIIGIAVRL